MQDLVPWLGTEPMLSALEARSLSHWSTKEIPRAHRHFKSGYLWETEVGLWGEWDRVRERISIPFYIFQYHFVYFKMWMYCLGKEKAKVKREASDCDTIWNKTRYLSCWFSVFSKPRKELRNDLPAYCCSFVLEYKSPWQACHWKDDTLAVVMFLEFSSQMSHIWCVQFLTQMLGNQRPSTIWDVASDGVKGPDYSISTPTLYGECERIQLRRGTGSV